MNRRRRMIVLVGVLGACTAEAPVAPQGYTGPMGVFQIDVLPSPTTVAVGASRQLLADPYYARYAGDTVDLRMGWESRDPLALSVSANGLVRGITAGRTGAVCARSIAYPTVVGCSNVTVIIP